MKNLNQTYLRLGFEQLRYEPFDPKRYVCCLEFITSG